MKIYLFEVREDEKKFIEKYQRENNLDIVTFTEALSLKIIDSLEPNSGISILGQHSLGEKEFKKLSARGINYVSTRTIGYNHINLEAAKNNGVHVCNASYAPNGVADYTIMMMLLCLRNYKQALWRTQVNDYSLGGLIGKSMKDLTVGVIGTGSIGTQVIKNLSGFGCKIICHSRHKNKELEGLAEYVSLEELYKESDIITLHTALCPETAHMINDYSIAMMKKGVIIINCARGGLAEIKALIKGIESEQIGALGIDCIENEEDIVHKNRKTDIFSNRDMAYIRQFKNVVHTQHMAFYTEDAVESMVKCGIEGLVEMEKGSYRLQLV